MKLVLIISTLFFLTPSCFASLDFTTNCKTTYIYLTELDTAKAKMYIHKEQIDNPNNSFCIFLNSYFDFAKGLFTENPIDIANFNKSFSKRINIISAENNNNPLRNFCLAEMFFHSFILKMQMNERAAAIYDLNKSYQLLVENEEIFPKFLPNKKTLNLIKAIWSTIPEEYQRFSKLFGIDGNLNRCISEMENLLNTCEKDSSLKFLYPETYLFLTFIKIKIDYSNPGQQNFCNRNQKKFHINQSKKHILLNLADAFQYSHALKNDSALLKFIKVKQLSNGKIYIHQTDYYIGLCLLRKLDSTANKYLISFLKNFKGNNLIKSANLRLAWYYKIFNNPKEYITSKKNVLLEGKNWINEDSQALKEVNENENMQLLKARLLFDGGYSLKALQLLASLDLNKDLPSFKEKLEYSYRMARIYHQMNEYEKAIELYKQVVEIGNGLPYYFAANSALQIGYIYLNHNKKEDAANYFKKCLKISCKEEENNIHQKAKNALKVL